MKRRTLAWMMALTTPLVASPACAQADYPNRPIRLVTPSGAGSVTDQTARMIADRLSTALKQSVVVDNRPGANGIIAAEAVAHAKPDGYTLLYAYAAVMAVNPWTTAKLPFDPIKDFDPVARPSGLGGNLLIVTASMPIKNLKEFTQWVAAQPAPPSYCSWGVGSGGHLSMEYIAAKTGIKLRHVPYKTAVQCANDVAAGHVTLGFADTISSLPHVKGGRIRPIAATGPDRAMPPSDVPTVSEQGVPFDQASWTAIFAPKGTPPAIIKRLNEEVNRIIQSPAERQRFEAINIRLGQPSTPQELGELVKRDIAAWGEIVKLAGVKAE